MSKPLLLAHESIELVHDGLTRLRD